MNVFRRELSLTAVLTPKLAKLAILELIIPQRIPIWSFVPSVKSVLHDSLLPTERPYSRYDKTTLPKVIQEVIRRVGRDVMTIPTGRSALAPLDCSSLTRRLANGHRPVPAPGSAESAAQNMCTDHMILARWTCKAGWEAPLMKASEPLRISPTASVLHYAIECFEGLKLYRGYDGSLRLFRPARNCERMRISAARVTLPDFDPKQLENMIVALCAQDGTKWLPKEHAGKFLYVRPTLISTDPALGVRTPSEALLYVILACFGDNTTIVPHSAAHTRTPDDLTGLRLKTSDIGSIRAWPGGFGYAKIGANYGPSLVAQQETQAAGYDQTLWLFGDQGSVTEAGGSNFFVVWKESNSGKLQLVTAPLQDGIILAGITRASILELARSRLASKQSDLGRLEVVERYFTMRDNLQAAKEGRLLEAFVCGTAYFVTPVSVIEHRGTVLDLEQSCEHGRYTSRMRLWLADVMWGDDPYEEWVLKIDDGM
ncbi:hypothetical protein LTR49_024963 [Elasticomyces elasticus]|nr:hypothetical protein LTR49_024963 [Elasticomyces elasticus]KAK5737876.1 hypothetical protein LTS12_025751 [Elasticomyces elasticus]